MNPEGDKVLNILVQRLGSEFGPMLTTAFAHGQLALTSTLMRAVANEYEQGAELRVKENAAIRDVLKAMAPAVQTGEMRAKLESMAVSENVSLKISDLDKANWDLRRLLIAAHAHLETVESEAAREAVRKVWILLKSIAEQRMAKLG